MANAPRSRTKDLIRLALSLGLSALFLYLAFASLAGCPDGASCVAGECIPDAATCGGADAEPCVSCLDWSNLPAQLADVSVLALVLFFIAYIGVHWIRIWRWYYLLRGLGLRRFGPAMRAGAIGLAAIIIVPLRLGEFVRPYLISKETRITMSSALGTAVVERVIDGLVVTLTLFVSLAFLPTRAEHPAFVYTAGTISAVIFGSVMIVLLFSWWQRTATIAVLTRIGNVISKKLTEKAIGLLEGFLDGVSTLRHGGDVYAFFALTVLYWSANAVTLVYLANAFGLGLNIWEGFAVTSILVIGIMVPGGPGHVGTFEFFMRAGLGLYIAVETMPERVVAFIAVIHVLQFLVQVLVAVPFWLKGGFSLRSAIETGESQGHEDDEAEASSEANETPAGGGGG